MGLIWEQSIFYIGKSRKNQGEKVFDAVTDEKSEPIDGSDTMAIHKRLCSSLIGGIDNAFIRELYSSPNM